MIRSGLAATATPALDRLGLPIAAPAIAQTVEWRHAFSVFNEIKYAPGFKQFDYVNPNPPKGGTVRLAGYGTFDNFNVAVAGLKGSVARGIAIVFDTLLTESLDEVSTSYGLLAEALKHPPDYAWATFRLNPQARWHDGKPVTPEDVIFSFDISRRKARCMSSTIACPEGGEDRRKRDHLHLRFRQPRAAGHPGAALRCLPKHWWKDRRRGQEARRHPDLCSRSPRLRRLPGQELRGRPADRSRAGAGLVRNLNVNVGSNNFDELRYEYFRDLTVALEGFKGDAFDFQSELRPAQRRNDFLAAKDKRVR
jgi:microcin C transport system substrate-binding protein